MLISGIYVSFQVHVSLGSSVPDHCRRYSLSVESDSDFTTTCNHQHDSVCETCNLFPTVLQEVEMQLGKAKVPCDVKEEMKFVLTQAKKNIEARKVSVNQDAARLDILNALDDTSVLVVLDWAMKFIPRKYRESQADWFGKRGISWHVSVAMRKHAGKTLQTLTLVHVLQRSSQDSLYVLAIIDDVIKKLKCTMPELKSLSFRQDNAGCYHSAATILGVRQLSIKHNVSVRLEFSDSQGGKGPCDRKAVVIKSLMRLHLDSGHDISNAEEMKLAIESCGGVRGVATVVCGPLTIPDPNPFPKWDGVSLLNDITFYSEEMRVWRAYGVGEGKVVPYSNFPLKEVVQLPFFDKTSDVAISDLSFSDLTPRRRQDAECTGGTVASAESNSETEEDTLFTCPEDGCVKSFQRFSSLQKHLEVTGMLLRESPYRTRQCYAMPKIWKAELHLSKRTSRRSFQKRRRRCLL